MLTARTAGHFLFSGGTSPARPDASYRANVVPPTRLGRWYTRPEVGWVPQRAIAQVGRVLGIDHQTYAHFQFFLALLIAV